MWIVVSRRRRRGVPPPFSGGVLALALALWPGTVAAQPSVSTSSSFDPVEPGRTYMDVGGAWNGTTDVATTGNGDVFTATLSNADDDPDEAAQDLTLDITLPTGFLYQTGTPLFASLSGPGCGSTPTVQVTDDGDSLDVDFDGSVEAYDLPDDCAVTVTFELLADIDASTGTNTVGFDWDYSNGGPAQATQTVRVRDGAPALVVDPLSHTTTGPGDAVSWDITASNEGDGGLFAVEIDETDLSDNPSFGFIAPLTVVGTPPRTVSIPNPPGDVATIPYLAPGESFTVRAEADVLSCDDLSNDVRSRHKVSLDDLSVVAEVVLDLQNPELEYTPLSGDLDYDDPVTFPIPVENVGAGTANDVTLQTNLENGGPAVTVVSTGPSGEWTYEGSGLFRYVGDQGAGSGNLPSGASTTLEVTLEPADVCTDLGGGTVEYEPRYENVCGTVFSSPTDSGPLGEAQPIPGLGVSKSASVSQLGIGSGDSARYDVGMSAVNTDLIVDDTFTITDELPSALGEPVTVSASAGTVTCPGGSCDPGETLTWDVANPGDGSTLGETLTIDFQAPPDSEACLGGTTMTNTATVTPATTTESCTVGGTSASAEIDLANVPTPVIAEAFHFEVTAPSPFETGQPGDGDCNQETGEGECIPHQATYEFEAGYPGVWYDAADDVGSQFSDDFDGVAAQQLVTATVEVNALQGGSTVSGGFQAVPASAILEDSGRFVLDLRFLADSGFFDDNNVSHPSEDREVRIRYSTTVSDAALPAGGTLTIDPTAQLIIRDGEGGSGACENTLSDPADTIYTTPGEEFTVQRAQVAVTVATESGQDTADVCEVLGLDIGVDNANPFQASDILAQLAVDGSDYRHVDPPPPSYGGQFLSLDNAGELDYDPGASGGPTWSFVDRALELTGGTIGTSVQLLPGATTGFGNGTPVTVRVDYDDNETTLSPSVGGTPTLDRAFTTGTSGQFTPVQVRQGDLSLDVTPDEIFVTGDQVSWTIFVTNSGDGGAYNVRIQNDLADKLGVNLADTDAATPSCGGDDWDLTNPSGDLLQWTIAEVPRLTTCEINVVADVPPTTACAIANDGPESNRAAGEWGCAGTTVQQGDLDGPYTNPLAADSPDFIFAEPSLRLTHEASFCNLCDPDDTSGGGPFDPDDGTVRLLVRNNGNSRIQDVEVIEELPTGVGIDLVPGTVEFSTDGGSTWQAALADPAGLGGGQYEFTSNEIPPLAELVTPSEENIAAGDFAEVLIRYNISSDESSLPGPHTITVSGQGERPCDGQLFGFGPRQDQIEVRAPDITVEKTGDNLDRSNDGTDERVVGIPGETIEWTIRVTNDGDHYTRQSRLRDILLAQIDRTSPGDSVIVTSGPGIPPGGLDITDLGDAYFALDEPPFEGIAPGTTAVYTIEETLGTDCFNSDNRADLRLGMREQSRRRSVEPQLADRQHRHGTPADGAGLLGRRRDPAVLRSAARRARRDHAHAAQRRRARQRHGRAQRPARWPARGPLRARHRHRRRHELRRL
ncbi:MAG: hypothetical protein U5K43_15720 [Halofilum sp. (in: g-proteobacteria)]|nr:hypothetical protein [Halofilum sp. (in: g-proteobacteria)]